MWRQRPILGLDVGPVEAEAGGALRHQNGVGYRAAIGGFDAHGNTLAVGGDVPRWLRTNPDLVDQGMDYRVADRPQTGGRLMLPYCFGVSSVVASMLVAATRYPKS